MECKTIKSFNKKGKPKFALKVKHNTFEEAYKEAGRLNNKKGVFIKRVAYLCNVCKTYHVGTSFEMLENTPKKVEIFSILPHFKIVNSVDLSRFEKVNLTKPNISSSENEGDIKNIKEGKILGNMWIRGGKCKWYVKIKTVKVILPSGDVKMPKIKNIIEEGKDILTNNQIKRYIKNNFDIQ